MISILKFEKNALFPYFGLDSIGKTYYNLRSKGGKTYLQDTQGVQNMTTNTANFTDFFDSYEKAVGAYLNKLELYTRILAKAEIVALWAQSASTAHRQINFLNLGVAIRRDAAVVKREVREAAQDLIDAAKQMRDHNLQVFERIVSMAEDEIR